MRRSKPRVSTPAVPVPPHRQHAAEEIARMLTPGMRVVLTTHVNADGDGAGSGVAMWHLLAAQGHRPVIANPTPFPARYAFLLAGADGANKSNEAARHLERAEAVVVLDISDVGRLGHLGSTLMARRVPVGCIDHHVSNGSLPAGPRMVDANASATGELVYDLAQTLGWTITPPVAQALYVALLTDTGGFRFGNTTPRALRIAAHLLETGLNAEAIYTRVYATSSEARVRLTGEVLETLVVEPSIGLAWVTVPLGSLERYGVDAEELEGVVEFARSIAGTRLAILFRLLSNGRVKASFRSVGDVDVSQLAARFGGGGHRKAAGASLEGSLAEVQSAVLQVARELLTDGQTD